MDCPPNVAPPECCAPPESDEVRAERGRRVDAAMRAALAAQPKHCPHCEGTNIIATFIGRQWECHGCGLTWED